MSDNFQDIIRTVEFTGNVELALAEDRGLFRPLAMQMSEKGKAIEVTDRFSRLTMREIATRNGKTQHVEPEVERRWIKKPKRSGVAVLLDADDKLATKVDAKSPIVTGVADAARQYHDDNWLQGFFGTAYVGEDGADTVAFKSANVIAADYGETSTSYVGLTLKKIKQLQFLRRRRFARVKPGDMLHVAITAYEVKDLLGITEFISKDYRASVAPLENGEPVPFMGIMWVPAEIDDATQYPKGAALAVNGSGHRRLPCWLPSGMAYNTWLEFQGHEDTRADMNHDEQVAGYANGRATRVHEDKCFIIECAGG
jgi:hypothetical protein